jgi:riboflavin synthase
MFTGIIEAVGTVRSFAPRGDVYELSVKRPPTFEDVKLGDSIAVDGVCLTVEAFDADLIKFALGTETIKVTQAQDRLKIGTAVNLERSLRFGDRVHGHLVSGHVDGVGRVTEQSGNQDFLKLTLQFPNALAPLIWKKGSIAINGVSLTINEASLNTFEVGLIPETLKRTNLSHLKFDDFVNLETDQYARGFLRQREIMTGKS